MPVVTSAVLAAAGANAILAGATGVGIGATGLAGLGTGLAAGGLAGYGMSQTGIGKAEGEFGDIFSPDLPDPVTPDPVAQESTLGATQAEERSLLNKAGLAGTKKVRTLLGKEQALGAS